MTMAPPAIARPARWPYLATVAMALALVTVRDFSPAGWFGGGAVVAAFFLGRRVGGFRVGLLAALVVTAGWLVWPPVPVMAATVFLALTGASWVMRFADDPAPISGVIAGVALGALALVQRFGAVGALLAAIFLSARLRPMRLIWPWLTGALLGWLLARAHPWF